MLGDVDCGGGVAIPLIDGNVVIGVLLTITEHPPSSNVLRIAENTVRLASLRLLRFISDTVVAFRDYELRAAEINILQTLALAEEHRDVDTRMHVFRVAHYCRAIAASAGIGAEQIELIFQAAPMHDIGKIGIPDSILLKPGPLTPAEFDQMKEHTLIGERILRGDSDIVRAARTIASTHHERWDGSGYPRGLRECEIPLFGRICSVADVFDALVTKRSYKAAWPRDQAVAQIQRDSGTHFDPDIVNAFVEAVPEILKIQETFREEMLLARPDDELHQLPRATRKSPSWRDEYSIGIYSIDVHHQYLFELTDNLAAALSGGQPIYAIPEAYKALENYTKIHFREEERLMEQCRYGDLSAHRLQHQLFVRTLEQNWLLMRNNPFLVGIKLVEFLKDWLIKHIRLSDKRAGEAIIRQQAYAIPLKDRNSMPPYGAGYR